MKFTSVFLLGIAIASKAFGQNYPLYGGYFINPYLYNPAEAATDHLQVFGNYRNQWVGLTGAPRVYTFGATTLLNDTRVGVGLKVSSFKRGFLTTSDAMLTYAYGVPIDKDNHVFFGISGGTLTNSVDWSMVADASDPALGTLGSSIVPAASFGMLYKHSSGVHIGMALPRMIDTKDINNSFAFSPFNDIVFSAYFSKPHPERAHTSNHIRSSSKTRKNGKTKYFPLELFTLYRYSKLGSGLEITAKMNFTSAIWLAASYRQQTGFIPSAGLHLGKLTVSYVYELGAGGDIPQKTHEVLLGLRLGSMNKYREKVPPVIAHRLEHQAVVAKNNPPAKTTPEPVKTAPKQEVKKEEPKQQVTQTQPQQPPQTQPPVQQSTAPKPAEKREVSMASAISKADSLAALHAAERSQLDKHIEDHKDGAHDDEHAHPVNQRHEFAKRGTHQEELEEGTFVIAGAFSSRVNADHYAKSLKNLGYATADFGHLSIKNIWYVFIADEADIETAKKERDTLQKKKIFKDVWLLTVHN